MIAGEIVGVDRVTLYLGTRRQEASGAIQKEVRSLAMGLLRMVKEDKLSGQVLKNQTGTLRRSINQKVVLEEGVYSGLVGTNVVYARAHEFGVDKFKVITVRAYFRKCKSRNSYAMKKGSYFSPQGAAALLKQTGSGVAFVGSFQRNQHTKLPERSFLRSSLREMTPEIQGRLAAALRKVLH
jgi:hypothetical protein